MRPSRDILRDKLNKLILEQFEGNKSEFARRIGVTEASIHRWLKETGVAPNLDSLDEIGAPLSIPGAELITEGPLPTFVTLEPTKQDILRKIEKGLDALEVLTKRKTAEDTELHEVASILASLDDTQRTGFIMQIKMAGELRRREKKHN